MELSREMHLCSGFWRGIGEDEEESILIAIGTLAPLFIAAN